MEFSYKKTEKIPGNAPNEEVQEDFEVVYRIYEEKAQKWDIHLVFYDPNHQLHNTVNWKKRQKKGKNGTLKIQSNTWRKRLNIMWWVDAITHDFIWLITEEKCNIQTTKKVLVKIRNFYRNQKKIVVILDNARYQRAYEVQEFAEKLGIELLFLPPYSPNLNLIERVRKFFKKRLSHNRYHPTFEDFSKEVFWFFQNFKKFRPNISNLVNWEFQIIKCV